MTAPVLQAQDLGKNFRRYAAEWHRIASWLGVPAKSAEDHWVLRHVSLSLLPGEALGIVGANGAGKSTLLKLIVGTLRPSEGSVQVGGVTAAILELGMGFNVELTGRQNAFHAAGLMGYSRETIERTMPDIEAFAEIGGYFEEPVRTYSSGMQMRLAFAVATAARPEILIVDEALSVGDIHFQRKCFRRIEEYVSKGTCLLLVSHDMETIKRVCSQAIYLSSGTIVMRGESKRVCDRYEADMLRERGDGAPADSQLPASSLDASLMGNAEVTYGDGRAVIEDVWLEGRHGEKANVFPSGGTLRVRYRVRFHEALDDPVFAIMVKTTAGLTVYGTDSDLLGHCTGRMAAPQTLEIAFDLVNSLAPGIYFLNCGIRDRKGPESAFIHRRVDTLAFRVSGDASSSPIGVADLNARIAVEVPAVV